jgi:Ca-activated chloride channel family protein
MMGGMPDFATPLALLLLPLPVAAWLRPPATRRGGALWVPETIASRLESASRPGGAHSARTLLAALLWASIVFAIAGPRTLTQVPALPSSGRDIVLALDLSGSMERTDFALDGHAVSRLDAVKHVGAEFARRRAGDRLGLVIFASNAFFAAPMTYDVAAVARAIQDATIGIAGLSTAISDGLGLALKRLESSRAASRVIVLLSDGENDAGSVQPLDAAGLARALGVRIHTIALGHAETGDGSDDPDPVDARTLRAIAAASGGTAFRVRTTADLAQVEQAIDALETSPTPMPPTRVFRELWIYPASLAFLLSLAMVFVRRVAA